MTRTWLKRIGIGLVVLVMVAALAGLIWWRMTGKSFLYGLILPDSELLLQDRKIPELDAGRFREDLAFLAEALPRLHGRYEQDFDSRQVTERIAALSAEAEEFSPPRRALEMMGLLALGRTGTGHTMLFRFQHPLDWRVYPLTTYWFDDGLFVTAAGDRHTAAIGSRIVGIGGVPVGEALERLTPYVASDNPSSLRGNICQLLGMAEPLVALGLASDDGSLQLELENSTTLHVEPNSITSFRGLLWSRRA